MKSEKSWVVASSTQCLIPPFNNYRKAEEAAFAIAYQTGSAVAIYSSSLSSSAP